jgi:hypothetical protein
VIAVADRFQAAAFDIDDVFWSHRGDRCTFDTMIAGFVGAAVRREQLDLG